MSGLRREIVFDTETTGFEPSQGHRIVEIGALELINHVPTGRVFHEYNNPARDMPEEAYAVHGLGEDFLSSKPVFAAIADSFVHFIEYTGDGRPDPAMLIAHNAAFDMRFVNHELGQLGHAPIDPTRVIDSLEIARNRYPGAPNSLDALCRRFDVDRSARIKHGALLDSELLAEVYLHLIGGRQPDLGLAQRHASGDLGDTVTVERPFRAPRPHAASDEERAAHSAFLQKLSGPLWQRYLDETP
ncbi:MAG: DNA polymerase III subunit epsilon [Geminicoccaceae bacterium]